MSKYNYEVHIPITGYVSVIVESDAPLEEDVIIQKAMGSDVRFDDIVEWDTQECVVSGNVFYGIQNEVDIVDSWEEGD